MSEPFAEQCSNDHRDDWWTCPGCYTDLGDVGKGVRECPTCKRLVECTVVQFPSCLAELVLEDGQ